MESQMNPQTGRWRKRILRGHKCDKLLRKYLGGVKTCAHRHTTTTIFIIKELLYFDFRRIVSLLEGVEGGERGVEG